MIDNCIEKAQIALEQGDESSARDLLRKVILHDRHSESAWFLFAFVAGDKKRTQDCLERVLRINPNHESARLWLKELTSEPSVMTLQNNPMVVQPSVMTLTQLPKERGDGEYPEFISSNAARETLMLDRIKELFADIQLDLPSALPDITQKPKGWTWQCDLDGRYLAVSPEVYEIIGYQTEDFIGQPMKSFALLSQSQVVIDSSLQARTFPLEIPVFFRTMHKDQLLIKVKFHIFIKSAVSGSGIGYYGFTEVLDDSPTIPLSTYFPSAEKPAERALPEARKNCPFIGLQKDPHSLTAYPSGLNYCYSTRQPEMIAISHQEQYCLGENYVNCGLFQAAQKALEAKKIPARGRRNYKPILLWGLVIVTWAILLGLLVYLWFGR